MDWLPLWSRSHSLLSVSLSGCRPSVSSTTTDARKAPDPLPGILEPSLLQYRCIPSYGVTRNRTYCTTAIHRSLPTAASSHGDANHRTLNSARAEQRKGFHVDNVRLTTDYILRLGIESRTDIPCGQSLSSADRMRQFSLLSESSPLTSATL
jgi:hypothetical protein